MQTVSIFPAPTAAKAPPSSLRVPSSLFAIGMAVAGALAGWQDRMRQRRALTLLDDRMLRDIGVSRAQLAGEVDKSFWQR
ncbi:uncharacterized protein YjiS (DUF1127 family) [Stella humosa]|uniref:Uncharacterized protein YjiS (DUF1127 family) n=1 Tax=Stella humosa TaxID=94 RepID=A0A3N1MEL9_9PROT|nr:uncharacterized protein YjiS (DUF1127 family) [Stella humosa]BBK32122.1 hypothetical protein STHU_27560 [Stella humosa]